MNPMDDEHTTLVNREEDQENLDEPAGEATTERVPLAEKSIRKFRIPPWLAKIRNWAIAYLLLLSAGFLLFAAVDSLSWEVLASIFAVIILAIVIAGYSFRWSWTGLTDYTVTKETNQEFQRGKTLWDWLQLLFIPTVLAAGVLMFNERSARVEHEIAAETQRETILQSYIDKMSELLLDKKLRKPESDSEGRNLAQTRTLSVLRRLDGERRGIVLQFLKAAELIKTRASGGDPIIDLTYADLSNTELSLADMRDVGLSNARLNYANLGSTNFERSMLIGTDFEHAKLTLTNFVKANLSMAGFDGANLSNANLAEANLSSARLRNVDASAANFTGADLTDAILENADLEGANLKDAKVTPDQLAKCRSLKGTTMPDGTRHN